MNLRFCNAVLGVGILMLATTLWAQTSPNYQLSNSGTVTTAGETSSPQFVARVVGGDGSPSQTASSSHYAIVLGPGDPGPPTGDRIFANSFEVSSP